MSPYHPTGYRSRNRRAAGTLAVLQTLAAATAIAAPPPKPPAPTPADPAKAAAAGDKSVLVDKKTANKEKMPASPGTPTKNGAEKSTGAAGTKAAAGQRPEKTGAAGTPANASGKGTPTVQPTPGKPDSARSAAGRQGLPGVAIPMPTAAGPAPVQLAGLPAGMMKLDFHSANIDTVLQAFSMAYKLTVIKDPAVTGDITIIESDPMDRTRAFEVLRAALDVRGFTASLEGRILKILPISRAIRSTRKVRLPLETSENGDEVITELVHLSNAEAGTMAKDLEPLLSEGAKIIGAVGANALIITDTASNIERLKRVITGLDKGAGNNEMEIFHLKHVPAKKMTEIVNDLFKQIAPRAPAAPMNPGQPQPPPQPGMAGAGGGRPAVAAVDDERTNSVIVVGSEDNLKRVSELVKKLDEELNPHNETKVYDVKYAEAVKLAQLINDALVGKTSDSSSNSGGGGFNPFGFNPFGGRGGGNQSQQASFQVGQTRIVADSRSNKLLITADDDMMKVVEGLLLDLDQPVEYETTTFAIKLKNVNAEDMAYVLGQALGSPNNNNQFGGFFGIFGGGGGRGSGQSRRDRRIERRQNTNQNRNNGGNFFFNGKPPAFGFKPDDPQNPRLADASQPDLPESTQRLAQFFTDYYGRRGGTQATTGRNSSGKYVNLLQLIGQVLITSERNTNSLIITTSPENAAAVKQLVSDLDVEVKQVLLEAIVAEVTLDNQTKFGLTYIFSDLRNRLLASFPVQPDKGPLGGGDTNGRPLDPLAQGLRYAILSGNDRIILTALGTDQKIRILSTPRVFTSNNQEAEIEVTEKIPFASTSLNFGSTTTSTEFIDVGLILNVTPRITADQMVSVDVYQEDSNLIEFRPVGNGTIAPLTNQRVTDTSVTLKDGDTLVLSGLQRTSRTTIHNKIPILGDLPIFGDLFRSTSKQNKRTELIVFLTPRVVSSADEARRLGDNELKRVQKTVPEARPTILDGGDGAKDDSKKQERRK